MCSENTVRRFKINSLFAVRGRVGFRVKMKKQTQPISSKIRFDVPMLRRPEKPLRSILRQCRKTNVVTHAARILVCVGYRKRVSQPLLKVVHASRGVKCVEAYVFCAVRPRDLSPKFAARPLNLIFITTVFLLTLKVS